MPKSHVRLSAGREQMDDATQALAFLAGANSIFYGDTLLTTGNPQVEKDRALFDRLGLHPERRETCTDEAGQQAALAAALEASAVRQAATAQQDAAGRLAYDAAQA